MKQFLIQVNENGLPDYDFCYQLIEAINYKNWFNNSNDYQYKLVKNDLEFDATGFIPVGSVEFVHKFLKNYFNIDDPKPINIPCWLWEYEYLKRDCLIDFHKDNIVKLYGNKLNKEKFIKSSEHIKGFTGITGDLTTIPDGRYLFSELIDIDSEWRSFIYNNKLVGLQNYAGDFTMFPDVKSINQMIKEYKDSPPAYTLDIGINGKDGTFLIEVHNFYSCGLYGFADLRILPEMFEKSFKWIVERSK